MRLFSTLKGYKKAYLFKDIFSGIIIAAVSIPISMGYAEVAGLPAVYGLYGSVFPILCFALFSTSPQFIFGVDAAPAAIVGASLASAGIAAGSSEAMAFVPLIALMSGVWLLVFYFLGAGKIVNYISTPVMGGFISGICLTIILMQIPKVLGGTTGEGELFELIGHIAETLKNVNAPSIALGIAALVCIRLSQKFFPKFPMSIVMMALGVSGSMIFGIEDYGVRLLSAVEPGLPVLSVPSSAGIDLSSAAGTSLTIAVVVMSETLLSENNFAFKNHYKIVENREILACAAGNIAAGLTGCCPVNGSISRTSMNEQFGGKTQAVSVTACAAMVLILLFGTAFIGYLPVPVLAAIVISALMNVVEFHLAVRLFKVSRNEFYIFIAACLGVLLLGTIYGVIIGIILSFAEVILKSINPPRTFLGIIPGRDGFYDLRKNEHAYKLKDTVIYQFSESLYFANIKIFVEDIEKIITDQTKTVIVDAGAVTGMDITAADQIEALAAELKRRGIRFFITEHMDQLNAEMRKLGIGHLIEEGMVRRTITAALSASGMEKPYHLEGLGQQHSEKISWLPAEEENSLEEFAWAFGDDAVRQIENKVRHIMDTLHYLADVQQLAEHGLPMDADAWKHPGAIDEDELLRRLEMHLDELPETLTKDRKAVMQLIENRRHKIEEQMAKEHPEVIEKLKLSRAKLERRLEKQNPEAAQKLKMWENMLKES